MLLCKHHNVKKCIADIKVKLVQQTFSQLLLYIFMIYKNIYIFLFMRDDSLKLGSALKLNM